jgi:hypothetical protein
MRLQSHWEEVRAVNGYDELPPAEQAILKKVFFTGAVASYTELQIDPSSLKRELDSFVADQKKLQGPAN